MRDGLGVWIGSNGEMYEGQWKQGKPDCAIHKYIYNI